MTNAHTDRNRAGETILVIEDSPTQAEHLRYILEKQGYHVAIAGNGPKALALLPTLHPALAISDIIMPGMDGYELCRLIKTECDERELPVILLTALSDPHDVIKGLECGADAFISKPYQEDNLLSRIRYLLANRSQCREGTTEAGIGIDFDGRHYRITADRRQILDLLLSTYETAIHKNAELLTARDNLKMLNDRLEVANKELEAFNYTVSHDLRSPLTNISGYCQVLLELYDAKLPEDAKGFIEDIYKSVLRMNQLISALLKFSRLISKEIAATEVNLSALAELIAAELRTGEPQRSVQFFIAQGLAANGDPLLLRAVLENLLGNAWKYSGKRERATIELGVNEAEGEKCFFIRDNGAGFDMSQSHLLFSAFNRLHSSNDFEGTGIGLATVQRIVERHGGRVWAEGEPDKGATFYFTLP